MFTNKDTKTVRLLHVVGDSRFGGAARIILRLGQVAKADGWQVDVLTTDPVFQQAARQHDLGVVDVDVIRRDIRPIWDLGGLVRLRKLLQSDPYQIVHTHTSKAGFVGRLAAWLAGVPVIVHTAHGFAFHERSSASARFFYSRLEWVASRWCDRIVSVSEFHRRWALELGICRPTQILAICNGIAGVRSPSIAPVEVRRRLGVREGDLLILSVARLAADKGLEYLIQAAAILQRTERRFHVVIAGDGPVRSQLQNLARSLSITQRVTFLGFREDVDDLLAACDLVVLPSLREGLSIALLEAMAAGKPIIATSIGSHLELASQAEIARLVPPADSQSICAAILRFARDPALMARLGTSARALFESRYTEERMLSCYRQLYFDLLKMKCPDKDAAAEAVYVDGSKEWMNDGYPGLLRPPHQPKGSGLWHERTR
jgi:glycosyltransferase involved in cell wall biosynthesis